MFDAVNSPNGTAFQSRLQSNSLMCGKTATSQVRRISMQEREEGLLKTKICRENSETMLYLQDIILI